MKKSRIDNENSVGQSRTINGEKTILFCDLKSWFMDLGFFTISVIAAFTVLFFICGPLYIYFQNSEEIWVPLSDIMMSVGVTSTIVFLVLTIFCFIVKDRISEYFVLLIFGSVIGMYVQGMINIRYGSGVLDGFEIDWAKYLWYGVIDSIVWLICFIIPFVIRRMFENKYKKIFTYASIILIIMQLSALMVQVVQYKPNRQISITKDKIYELATDSNMLIFILDTMDEAYYKEFIDNNPEFTQNLEGFVHYDNTMSSGYATILGIPSMLSGKPFRNDKKYSDYISSIWSGENPLRSIHDKGTNIGIYSESLFFSNEATDYIVNFSDQEASLKSHYSLCKKLYKLAGFTYFPHIIKPYLIKGAADFESLKNGDDLYLGGDAVFYSDFKSNGGYSFTDEYSKAIRIYHLSGAHAPYTLNSQGERTKETSLEEQVEGCFNIINYFLDDLKRKKMYDSAYIVITADHGRLGKGQNPVFLVKQPGVTNSYSTSSIPISLFDLPICMSEFSGDEVDYGEFGSSINNLYSGQIRERHMFKNTRGSTRLKVVEYVTTGRADDIDALTEYNVYQDNRNADRPYELGKELFFDSDGEASIYSIEGISGTSGYESVMYGPEAVYKLPVQERPKGNEILIELGIGSGGHISDGLNYNIYVNGFRAYQGVTDKSMAHSEMIVRAPIEEVFSQDEQFIEIRWDFSDLDKDEMKRPLLKRTTTYPLKSICVDVK